MGQFIEIGKLNVESRIEVETIIVQSLRIKIKMKGDQKTIEVETKTKKKLIQRGSRHG